MAALRRRRGNGKTRWEEDNRLALNPGPIVAIAAVAAALAGLAVVLWLVD